MPKGHRTSRSQGSYRNSPVQPLSTPTYSTYSTTPLSRTMPSSASTYYSTTSTLPLSSNIPTPTSTYPPTLSTPTYPSNSGGPVLPPTSSSSYPLQPPLLPPQSLRPSSGAWTPSDDATLMQARSQGLNWAPIQQTYFPSKTPNACRKRHERLMERRNTDDWDVGKLENMAGQYVAMRREIWTPLAEALGEKWMVVEAKCMTHGIKNLQSLARASSRRSRLLETSNLILSNSHSHHQSLPSPNPNSPLPSHSHHTSTSHSPHNSIHSIHHSPHHSSSSNHRHHNGGGGMGGATLNTTGLTSSTYATYDDSGISGISGGFDAEEQYDAQSNRSGDSGYYVREVRGGGGGYVEGVGGRYEERFDGRGYEQQGRGVYEGGGGRYETGRERVGSIGSIINGPNGGR